MTASQCACSQISFLLHCHNIPLKEVKLTIYASTSVTQAHPVREVRQLDQAAQYTKGKCIRYMSVLYMSQHVLWVDSVETCVPANLVDHFSVLCDSFHRQISCKLIQLPGVFWTHEVLDGDFPYYLVHHLIYTMLFGTLNFFF